MKTVKLAFLEGEPVVPARNRRKRMNIGVGYGRRTAGATLGLIGLLIVTGPMHGGTR